LPAGLSLLPLLSMAQGMKLDLTQGHGRPPSGPKRRRQGRGLEKRFLRCCVGNRPDASRERGLGFARADFVFRCSFTQIPMRGAVPQSASGIRGRLAGQTEQASDEQSRTRAVMTRLLGADGRHRKGARGPEQRRPKPRAAAGGRYRRSSGPVAGKATPRREVEFDLSSLPKIRKTDAKRPIINGLSAQRGVPEHLRQTRACGNSWALGSRVPQLRQSRARI